MISRSCGSLSQKTYATGGRPSIDPVVFFKLQLVMYFEGLRSERQLMRHTADRLSVLWYLGYDLGKPLPDHSSLTRSRERYRVEVLRGFFEKVVEQCQEAGLVWGKELYFDATQVNANADLNSLTPRFAVEAREAIQAHLAALFAEQGKPGRRAVHGLYRRTADFRISTTDPDATPMRLKGRDTHLGYQSHYVVDEGERRIILGVLVTPGEVMENQPMLDLLWRVRFRWKL